MTRSIADQCRAVAWAQWAELGVSASGVLVAQHGVDLEPAIVFAPILLELDPRLHDEVLDWCARFAADFVSLSVLRHTLKMFDNEHQKAFMRFASTINSVAKTKWPASREGLERVTLSGKSRARLDRPGAVQLRARKIFGMNARADIIAALAQLSPTPEPRWTHVNLLADLGYTRRNLTDALNDLAIGGLLGTMRFTRVQYALRHGEAVRELLAPMPVGSGRPWAQLLSTCAHLLRVEMRTRGKSTITRVVETRAVLDERKAMLARVGLVTPELGPEDPSVAITDWLSPLMTP